MGLHPTPAPWTWAEDRLNGGWSGLIGPDGEEVMFPLCRNDGDEGATWFEPGESMSEQDARLIAAAPDLYEALGALCVSVEMMLAACGDEERLDLDEGYQIARRALAKAQGKEDAK